MGRKIRIGSRDSKLAVIQSEIVMENIRRRHPEIELELITMKTIADKNLDKTLDKIGGKGLFIKELEQGLIENEIDLCVHCLKDMEVDVKPELPIVAIGEREDPRDVLVLPEGCERLSAEKPLGSSSKRRMIQMRELLDVQVEPVRGNVLTRLEKLDRGEFSGLVLANAGLIRLDLTRRVSRIFSVNEVIPAVCQGILAIQGRKGEDYTFLDGFHSETSAITAEAERMFVRTLNCGCGAPVAVYSEVHKNELRISGMYYDEEMDITCRHGLAGTTDEAEKLGEKLANDLLSMIRHKRVM